MTDNNDNIVYLEIPTREEAEAMELQEEIFEEFGSNGLFTMQMISAVFSDLMDHIAALETRVEALEGCLQAHE